MSWPEGADRPDTDISHDSKKRGTVWGGFLGVLIGMLFFIPLIGAAVGAAIGAAVKAMEGTGIGKEELETDPVGGHARDLRAVRRDRERRLRPAR